MVDGAEPTRRRGYRGPAVVGFLGFAIALVGVAAALAAFAIVQTQGTTAFAGDLLGPVAKDVLGTDVAAPQDGGGGASLAVVIAFVVGCVLAAGGSVVMLGASAWALYRWSPGGRGRRTLERAQPALELGRRGVETARPVAKRAAWRSRVALQEQVVPRGRRLLARRRRPEPPGVTPPPPPPAMPPPPPRDGPPPL